MAAEIGVCLEPSTIDTYLCGAYSVLKCWYRHVSTRATNPSWSDMDKATKDYGTFNQREYP